MILADLHTHTNFSDGELSPSEILNEALLKKIKYLSITDHDTLTGYKKAKKIVSSSYNNQITHQITITMTRSPLLVVF